VMIDAFNACDDVRFSTKQRPKPVGRMSTGSGAGQRGRHPVTAYPFTALPEWF
jgi:hypothetical protein